MYSHWNNAETQRREREWEQKSGLDKPKKKGRTKRLISGIATKGRPAPNKGITAYPVLEVIKKIGVAITMHDLLPYFPLLRKEQVEHALRFLKANGHVITAEIPKIGMSGARMTYKAV